jgi:hypothetical protein
VSSLWEQRAARNEALFREVNDNIARLEERHGATTTEPVYLCECADSDCIGHLAIDPDDYRRVRGNPRLFIVLPGHEEPRIEQIVERHDGYLIVEKTGEAGEVAEQTESAPADLP